jgi:hypothetical protein
MVFEVNCPRVWATDNNFQNQNQSTRAIRYSDLPDGVCGIESKDVSYDFDKPKEVERFGETSNGNIMCTCSVISGHELLTAAHCVSKLSPKGHYAIVCPGGIRRDFVPQTQSWISPDFNPEKDAPLIGDIAVIRVKDELGIPPYRLPHSREEFEQLMSNSGKCIEIGFGKNTKNGRTQIGLVNGTVMSGQKITPVSKNGVDSYWNKMNSLFTPIVHQELKARGMLSEADIEAIRLSSAAQLNEDSEKQIESQSSSSNSPFLFVHGKGGVTRHGDSGGPLLCKSEKGENVILGILSSGAVGLADMFDNAWIYESWIKDHLTKSADSSHARVETLKVQMSYRCRQLGNCLGTIRQQDLELSQEMVKILQKVSFDPSDFDSADGSTLDQKLEKVKTLLTQLIEFCFKQS